ncbi:hypothetical protein A3F66_04490 [candidate division TM6 bacterium RIFCSPHIGHO2_12_FULL_32_22]|nr:MAG: hypothetical protein A3F66_04490 [candidate division TM6 bacterium RIFCSPHIGHO2_12_FULL_32_22]
MNKIIYFSLLLGINSTLFGPRLQAELDNSLSKNISKGNIEEVRNILDSGANVNKPSRRGTVPLMLAVFYNNPDMVKLLIDKGADVNQADKDGNTPLTWAAREGHIGIVKLLLDSGADVNQADKYEETPLKLASKSGHIDIVKLLEAKARVSEDELIAALWDGRTEIARFLINSGARLDESTMNEILFDAVRQGRNEIITLLIELGADIDHAKGVERGGMMSVTITPLLIAAMNNNVDAVHLLLSAGADVTKSDLSDVEEIPAGDLVDKILHEADNIQNQINNVIESKSMLMPDNLLSIINLDSVSSWKFQMILNYLLNMIKNKPEALNQYSLSNVRIILNNIVDRISKKFLFDTIFALIGFGFGDLPDELKFEISRHALKNFFKTNLPFTNLDIQIGDLNLERLILESVNSNFDSVSQSIRKK